jgi:hypothetical protein
MKLLLQIIVKERVHIHMFKIVQKNKQNLIDKDIMIEIKKIKERSVTSRVHMIEQN